MHRWIYTFLTQYFDTSVSRQILSYLHMQIDEIESVLKLKLGDTFNLINGPKMETRILSHGKRFYLKTEKYFTYKISRENRYIRLVVKGEKTWLTKWNFKEEKQICVPTIYGISMFISQVQQMGLKSKKSDGMARLSSNLELVQIEDNHRAKRLKLSVP